MKDGYPNPEQAEKPKKMDALAEELAAIDDLLDQIKQEVDSAWVAG